MTPVVMGICWAIPSGLASPVIASSDAAPRPTFSPIPLTTAGIVRSKTLGRRRFFAIRARSAASPSGATANMAKFTGSPRPETTPAIAPVGSAAMPCAASDSPEAIFFAIGLRSRDKAALCWSVSGWWDLSAAAASATSPWPQASRSGSRCDAWTPSTGFMDEDDPSTVNSFLMMSPSIVDATAGAIPIFDLLIVLTTFWIFLPTLATSPLEGIIPDPPGVSCLPCAAIDLTNASGEAKSTGCP